eukprot:TRINITY_DN5360_c0_g1_i5.p2 TRINITY_DN5360_c0_g1~~TRINITY_DN5360_c0_g1_i5.p2  ORF type:complete len:100 (+),score=9.10 TRINITY_DN5360_c0_g1_i5:897-1196(+)
MTLEGDSNPSLLSEMLLKITHLDGLMDKPETFVNSTRILRRSCISSSETRSPCQEPLWMQIYLSMSRILFACLGHGSIKGDIKNFARFLSLAGATCVEI